ncbi:SH3 domain-containing protein [Sphingomonas soli]|uniref:SH3 domain-containing protein n=1 Tax=Sphingomonas soli TaxID=266127 RepID=UPI000A812FF7|nr:SH3 domain-containing protein [Sphingomonas soli]
MLNRRMRIFGWIILALVALGMAIPAFAQRKPPYFASIAADKARMRTGPGRNYPASWLYQRADLPIKVIDIYGDWRKIEDPDGTQGWMQVNLLSDTRTAMVTGTVTEMRAAPNFNARINWRAAPGVVGRIRACSGGWCWFDVRGRGGYVEQSHIWGTEPGETLN